MKIYWIGLNWITNSIKLPYQQLNLAHLLNLLKPTPVPHPQQYLRWHQIRMGETKTKKKKKTSYRQSSKNHWAWQWNHVNTCNVNDHDGDYDINENNNYK